MFHKQIAAHLGMRALLHHEPYRMGELACVFVPQRLVEMCCAIVGKYVEVSPEDVIWANLNLNPYEQKVWVPPFPVSLYRSVTGRRSAWLSVMLQLLVLSSFGHSLVKN